MDIKDYLNVIVPKLWVIILGAVLAAIACYYVATTYTNWPTYEASGTLSIQGPLVEGSTTDRTFPNPQDLPMLQSTLRAFATRPPLTQNVVDSLGLDISEQDLAALIRIRTPESTMLFEVNAIHKDPNMAAAIADAVLQELHSNNGSNIETTIHSDVKLPKAPLTSSYLLILIAAAMGSVIAIGGVLFAEYFNDIIRNERDIVQNLEMTMLGKIDDVGNTNRQMLQMQQITHHAYQWLFANIYVKNGQMPNSILITSPQFCQQQSEFVSMFIQCNLRRNMPLQLSHNFAETTDDDNRVQNRLEVQQNEETTEVLTGPIYNLDVVEKSLNMADGSAKRRSQIVDAPPVLASVNTVMMSKRFESVLMVLDAHKTRISDTKKAAQLLNDAGARVIGAVLLT